LGHVERSKQAEGEQLLGLEVDDCFFERRRVRLQRLEAPKGLSFLPILLAKR
jgi:hypothetical protein